MLHNHSLVYWSEWNLTTITIGVNEFIYSVIDTTHFNDSINPVWVFQGAWPGSSDNTTVWPQQMIFDWIKVYQHKSNMNKKIWLFLK